MHEHLEKIAKHKLTIYNVVGIYFPRIIIDRWCNILSD